MPYKTRNEELQGIYLEEDKLALQVAKMTPKHIHFEIRHSDRPNSKTLYIYLMTQGTCGYWYKDSQIRVSDHYKKCDCYQFLVEPEKVLDKNKKNAFKVIMGNAVQRADRQSLKRKFRILEK